MGKERKGQDRKGRIPMKGEERKKGIWGCGGRMWKGDEVDEVVGMGGFIGGGV